MGMEERERVERDTDEIQDIAPHDLLRFLLPEFDGAPPAQAQQFSLSFNRAVLDGWVRQPSACCGAASVAGAWNALAGRHRSDHKALTHLSVLGIYRAMFVSLIERKMLAYERKLGAKLPPLLLILKRELNARGKSIGGKRAVTGTRRLVGKVLQKLARERWTVQKLLRLEAQGNPDKEVELERNRDALDCIVDLFLLTDDLEGAAAEEEEVEGEEKKNTKKEAAGAERGEEEEEEEYHVEAEADEEAEAEEEEGEDEVEDEAEDDEANKQATKKAGRGKKKTTTTMTKKKKVADWDWLGDLMAILKNIGGLKKIVQERPSTAPIGNWGIQQGVERLSEQFRCQVTARLFMGKAKTSKSKLDVPLSRSDGPREVTAQWDKLRSAFNTPGAVLLFHLKNHYALVHALREWVSVAAAPAPATVTRQLLTARKGQRPTAWIDFDEAREQMLAWEGYKILVLAGENSGGEEREEEQPNQLTEEQDALARFLDEDL